ncbi:hypothetical protein RYX36_020932 [Vicia faba]
MNAQRLEEGYFQVVGIVAPVPRDESIQTPHEGMNDNHRLRVLMLEDVDQKRRDHAKHDMEAKLKIYKDGYTKCWRLMWAL